jgi:hypothetical protein
MATIHTGTTMAPTKLELLSDWLPRQPWYLDAGSAPQLSRAGGFRLDDPAGEVGIEFMVVTDAAGGGEATYLVPMTYRAAPLAGAEAALIGTSEHGVLGTRWIYDGAHDPVAVTQLLDFIGGRVEAQHQSRSDTLDPSVGRSWTSAGRPAAREPLSVSETVVGRTTVAAELDGSPCSLDLLRVLPGAEAPALGSVEADWTRPDGGAARGTVAVVR